MLYPFQDAIAIDPHTKTRAAPDAQGQIYGVEDQTFTTPLAPVDENGFAVALVPDDEFSVLPQFWVEDHTVVVFKSGDFTRTFTTVMPLPGPKGDPGEPGEATVLPPSEVEDATVAPLVADPTSATRTALNVATAEHGGVVNVLDHGARPGASGAENRAAFQSAANAARDTGATLHIPAGDFRLVGFVDVYTAVTCVGRVVVSSTAPGGVHVRRTNTPVTLAGTALTGLAAGSRKVGGHGSITGTLRLRSTELSIKRTAGGDYTKADVAEITKADGTLSVPLVHSYDSLSTVTATIFPTDAAITVDGLNVHVTNDGTEPAEVVYLGVYRSNVRLRNSGVTGNAASALNSGISIGQATNTIVENPVVKDIAGPYGYGIAAYETAHTRYVNATVTGCRHAVSGYMNKDLRIDKGTYEGGIDDHWVYGLHVTGATSVITDTPLHSLGVHVLVAGRDITVKDITAIGGGKIVGIRADTPELGGDLIVEGGVWQPGSHGGLRAVGYASGVPVFDFGRPVASPTLCRVTGLRMRNAPAAVSIVRNDDNQAAHTYWRRIEIDGVTWTDMAADVLALWTDRRPALHATDTAPATVLIKGLDFTNNFATVRVYNTGDTTTNHPWAMRIEDCKGIRLELAENALAELTMVRGSLRAWAHTTSTSTAPAGRYRLEGVLLDAVAFNSRFVTDFSGCTWRGGATHQVLSANDRVRSYVGNLHELTATGHPTHPDGYRNTTYYKAA